MDDLLSWLFATAVQLSGLPATETRPPVEAMPYQAMLSEICADLTDESKRLQAQFERCAVDHAMLRRSCDELKPDPRPYEQCTRQTGLMAAYLIGQHRIVYRDDLDLENDSDNSFIVHEFVHALQDRRHNGRLFETCSGVIAAERQAYAVQQRYLRSRGQLLRVGERLRQVRCEDIR